MDACYELLFFMRAARIIIMHAWVDIILMFRFLVHYLWMHCDAVFLLVSGFIVVIASHSSLCFWVDCSGGFWYDPKSMFGILLVDVCKINRTLVWILDVAMKAWKRRSCCIWWYVPFTYCFDWWFVLEILYYCINYCSGCTARFSFMFKLSRTYNRLALLLLRAVISFVINA